MKKILFFTAFIFAASLTNAQKKADQIAAYLGARYATIAPPGKWEFYFATTTIMRVSDGTKYFPELLAAAPNWSNAPDGQLEQIRWDGKKVTDMREAQAQKEKPAQKLRMVGSGNLDSLKIADGVQKIMEQGPGQLISLWASTAFKWFSYFMLVLINLFYFFTKACLNETKINRIGIPVVGRYMYLIGTFFSSIQNVLAIVSGAFLAVTAYALILSETFFSFVFLQVVYDLTKTAIAFAIANWCLLRLVDRITPEPPMVNEERIGISFNSGGQQGLPMGGGRRQ